MSNHQCEDFPCCGHTDGLGCNWTPESVYSDPHLLCDHNTGYCDLEDDEEDEFNEEQQQMADEWAQSMENDSIDRDYFMEDQWLDGSYEQ